MGEKGLFSSHKITNLAHHAVTPVLRSGDRAVDATAGNGYDTVYLAEKTGPSGHVYAFDVQREALDRVAEKLSKRGLDKQVTLINEGHEKMAERISGQVSVIMYNLGYLPGSSSEITTSFENVLESIQQGLTMLRPGGIISVVLYPGHEDGRLEKAGLLPFFEQLASSEYTALHYNYLNRLNNPPELVIVQKNSFPL